MDSVARIARVVAPGVPHDVTRRGERRIDVFFSDEDWRGMHLGHRCLRGLDTQSACGLAPGHTSEMNARARKRMQRKAAVVGEGQVPEAEGAGGVPGHSCDKTGTWRLSWTGNGQQRHSQPGVRCASAAGLCYTGADNGCASALSIVTLRGMTEHAARTATVLVGIQSGEPVWRKRPRLRLFLIRHNGNDRNRGRLRHTDQDRGSTPARMFTLPPMQSKLSVAKAEESLSRAGGVWNRDA